MINRASEADAGTLACRHHVKDRLDTGARWGMSGAVGAVRDFRNTPLSGPAFRPRYVLLPTAGPAKPGTRATCRYR